ncbi:hypothetical protein BWQ96_09446 [Gracilariopsis chorda]|uniref:Uncharacterized protein n=1 Tax=Gracilariopsis chorda TaxID=448386 RepID=A0A2V3IFI6_9FLOR|nr:hypothetical protein BWQ96_09446 [Gracilariopsis chorda]|eukprot:PXF40856.1 hypothetical protein BWQ96_09446 [Gracilariopsis chorda]
MPDYVFMLSCNESLLNSDITCHSDLGFLLLRWLATCSGLALVLERNQLLWVAPCKAKEQGFTRLYTPYSQSGLFGT